MKFNQYPTAFEVRYRFLLDNIYEQIDASILNFIDITLGNDDVIQYLEEKGFIIIDIRYEYKNINNENKWGFFGRTTGDGTCVTKRIIWGDVNMCMKMYGDFRR